MTPYRRTATSGTTLTVHSHLKFVFDAFLRTAVQKLTGEPLSWTVNVCVPADLSGVSGSNPLKPQRSLPGTPVSVTHCPIDLRTSMEEKYKEIAEVKVQSRPLITSQPCGTGPPHNL